MFKKRIWAGIGVVAIVGIGGGAMAIVLNTHESLEDINGKENGMFYEKKNQWKLKKSK